jgi:hypothetical protein
MKPLHFSVDCEFTDNNVYRGALLSVGIVCENGQSTQHLLPVSTDAKVNAWTLQNNYELLVGAYLMEQRTSRLPRMRVGREWMNPQLIQAAALIQEFVLGQRHRELYGATKLQDPTPALEKMPAVMVTWSGGHDWAYLCSLFGRCNVDNPFHYRMIDCANLAMALWPELGEDGWGIPQDDCCRMLGLEPLAEEKKHIAIEDARHQLAIFHALKEKIHEPAY